jgi:hypothetical protein
MPKPRIEVNEISFSNFSVASIYNGFESQYSFKLHLGINYTTADVSTNLPALTGDDTQFGGVFFDISNSSAFTPSNPVISNLAYGGGIYKKVIHCTNSTSFNSASLLRTTLTTSDLSGVGTQTFARTIDISFNVQISNGLLSTNSAPPKSLSLTQLLNSMGLTNAVSSQPFVFALHGDPGGGETLNDFYANSIDLVGSATVARLLAAAAGSQFNAPLPYRPPSGFVSAPTLPKAYLGASNIWLSWQDTANSSLIDFSNNIYYQLQYQDQDVSNNTPFSDVIITTNTTDTDLQDFSGNVALFRKTNATVLDLSFNTTYKFRVRAGRFNLINGGEGNRIRDTAIVNANMSSFTEFTYYNTKGVLVPGQAGLLLRNRLPEVDFSSAIIDNTKSIYLPPGTYQVGNGGSSFIGNNALLDNNNGLGFGPYGTRWTITDALDKTYAARQSDYKTTNFSTNVTASIPAVDISASFALSNGVYTFTGFPLDTIRDDAGKVVIDAYNSWPVVVLQQKSANKVTVSGVDVTKNNNTLSKYNQNVLFKNKLTNKVILPSGIHDNSDNGVTNSFYSFADAKISDDTDNRYVNQNDAYTNQEDVSGNISKRAILVKGLDAVKTNAITTKTNVAALTVGRQNGAAFASLGVNEGTNGNGWLSLLPQITTYYADLSNASASRTQLITDISNRTVFPDASANRGLYTQSVTIKVDTDFSNNKIHFWDPVWGWNTQGYNMFTYQPAVVAPTTTLVGTPTDVSGTINLATVLTNTYGEGNLTSFGAGGDAAASRNAQTILTSLANANVDLSNPNVKVTVPANLFPLSSAFTAAINSASSTVTDIRLFNAGSNYADVTTPPEGKTGKITSLPILEVTGNSTQAFYVNLDTAGDAITFTSNDGNLTITLKTTKAAGVTNQYIVSGFDVGSLVTATPATAGNNAVDGATFTFLGVPFFLGGVGGGGVLPNVTTICFQRGTKILTPSGYKPVEELLAGDLLTNTHNGTVPVRSMIKFIGKKEDGALYCLPKDSLKKNKPLNDLYMSGDHAFKHNGIWRHMNCASGERFSGKKSTYQTEQDDIEYYHIIIDDYFAHTIVAEGVEVETCFEDRDDGLMMAWACNEKCCTPMKYEAPKPKTPVLAKKNVLSLLNAIPRTVAPPAEEVKAQMLGNKKTVKKSMMAWKYDRKLERNMAVQCNEISLPN